MIRAKDDTNTQKISRKRNITGMLPSGNIPNIPLPAPSARMLINMPTHQYGTSFETINSTLLIGVTLTCSIVFVLRHRDKSAKVCGLTILVDHFAAICKAG